MLIGTLAATLCFSLVHVSRTDARSLVRVTFPSLDRDDTGAPVQLQAMLLLPDGPAPAGGYPAIVALHGCSGMYSMAKGREDHLSDRLAVRAEMYLNDGYAVLFPDSFRSRSSSSTASRRRMAASRSG